MVNVYTRHRAECDHGEDMRWRRCRCPKWIRGVLINGKLVRESAKTRSWEQAERVARKMEEDADPTTADQAKPCRVTVAEAVQMFLKDEEARGLELLRKNPMEALKKPKTPETVPTDYFRPEEFAAILKATEEYAFGGAMIVIIARAGYGL